MKEESDRSLEEVGLLDELARLRVENARFDSRVKALERRLSLQPQSGLPTHFRLEIELESLIARLRDSGDRAGFSLLIVQLGEDYSNIRKTLKTSVSEWILYQTGSRISSMLRPGDLLFHTRETEFVIILLGLKGQALARYLSAFLARLTEPHIFSGLNIQLRTSMGAAYWPEHGRDRTNLLHHADIAAGAAREKRRAFTLFRPELKTLAVRKVELQNAIIRAIEKSGLDHLGEEFFLAFQPKIFARALEGGRLAVESVEAEVLLRWRHPEFGVIGPDAFIPLAEETGLILPLGKWLIYQSLARYRELRQAAGAVFRGISLNLSARQFRSSDAADVLSMALSRHGIPAEEVTVELTETALFEEPALVEAIMGRFRDVGVRISMDDFGTGYSSLSHLHRFPLDEIKIDRQFVEELPTRKEDRIIVTSLVAIARGMDLSLVAEGVEKKEAVTMLWELGCRGFQGFLFSEPLGAGQFAAFCRRIAENGMVWEL